MCVMRVHSAVTGLKECVYHSSQGSIPTYTKKIYMYITIEKAFFMLRSFFSSQTCYQIGWY